MSSIFVVGIINFPQASQLGWIGYLWHRKPSADWQITPKRAFRLVRRDWTPARRPVRRNLDEGGSFGEGGMFEPI